MDEKSIQKIQEEIDKVKFDIIQIVRNWNKYNVKYAYEDGNDTIFVTTSETKDCTDDTVRFTSRELAELIVGHAPITLYIKELFIPTLHN